jgi:hypothetical protein
MPKFPQDTLLTPQFVPDPFGFASSPTSDQLNTLQGHVHQDLRRLYDLYRTLDAEVGSGSVRVAVDASNFTLNSQAVRDLDYLSRLRHAIAISPATWTANTTFATGAKMRAVRVPMELMVDYTPGSSPAWRNDATPFTPTPIYQDAYSGMLLGAMDTVDYRYRATGTTITLSAVASDGTELITGTTDSADVFDQSKETQLVLYVDREIEDETGKTDEPYEELTVTITTAPSISTFNALAFEFGLPMDIDDLMVGASPTAATDENSEDLNAVDTTATSKFHNQFTVPYENITRRTIFLADSADPVSFKLRSVHWIPINDRGTVKKRFLFPIYNIDAIDYTPTVGTSYGIVRLDIPKEWAIPANDSDEVIFPSPVAGPTVAVAVESGIHHFPTFVRENAQSNIVIQATESNAKDINLTTHALPGAATNHLWLRVELASGTYIPRLDAAFLMYEIA